MTRLAKHLGMDGYEALRQLYADAVRNEASGFAGKAGEQAKRQKLKGDHALAAEMLTSLGTQLAQLAAPASLDNLVRAARMLERARRVYCLGLRSSHSVAWQLHYILSLIGGKSIMLDGIAAVGADPVGSASAADVLVAASVRPYTRLTIEIAGYAHARGVPVVAITDSVVAPLAQIAACRIIVPTDSPSFIHAMSPAFVVAEVLGALAAGHGGEGALEALRRVDHQLAALDILVQPGNRAGRQP